MENSTLITVALVAAMAIIIGLAYYAGKLLFMLREQTVQQQNVRQTRINNIIQSIQTIAAATEQQQCNLSEAAIRICRLLASLPLEDIPDYNKHYPALHALFDQVKHLPTHEDRQALGKKERRAQDLIREEQEAQLESRILKEVTILKGFSV